MSDEKQSFVIYRNWMELVMALPDDTALDLTRTIFAYCLNRDYNPDPTAAAIFDTVEPLLERDIEKWYNTRAERVKAGQLGGQARAKQMVANGSKCQANANHLLEDAKQNQAVYVNVYGNVNENVDGNDNVVPSEQLKKEDTIVSKKEVRHKYGAYNNVLLTDTEMEKLQSEFPDWQDRIERLSEYMESKGAKYKNHLATIRAWARKNDDKKKRTPFSVIDDMDFGDFGKGNAI